MQALDDVVVLDLTHHVVGPYATRLLADFGADVIKVESPDGDAFRGHGLGFLGWNRGKRGLSVDSRRPEGRAIVHELVRTADVVVENFRPGAAQRLALDYETLADVNPRLIYASVSAFGDVGPDAGLPGFDPLLQARSGAMAAQGGMDRGHPPVFLQVALCDYAAALLAAYGVCAALAARERTGRGQRVETTLVHAALAAQAGEFIWYEGRPPWPAGAPARLGAGATDRLYQAADGWLRLSLHDPPRWRARPPALAAVPGEEAVTAAVDGEVAGAIAAAFALQPLAHWLAALREAGVPAAPVLRSPDLFSDPQIIANDLVVEHDHPRWGRVGQTGVLAKFARTPGVAQRPAPLLGQHSREVLREAGYDDARIDGLVREGIVVQG